TGRVQETEAKLEPDRLWVAVKDNSQKLIDDLDTVNRNYAYIDEYNYICLSNDFPRNKKQYLSLSLWGNFEEFANADPFSEIFFGGRFDSPFLDYKYTRKSVNHIVYEGGYVDLSLETNKDLTLSLYGMAPEELITKVKIDLGTKATDWTPAPEELLTPEDIKASIELTTNGLDVFGKHHSLEGKVTFASLASDAQGKINSAQSTANTALTNANSAGSNLTTLQGRLGELAYEDMVERAKLGSTIIEGSYLRTELIEAKSITAEKIDVDSIFANRIRTGNLDVLEGATIGSFEIGNGRIGVKIDDPTSASFGNLAIYSDFFRVGGSNGYVMFGDNVIPASSGGAFTATGRIVNKRTNKGSDWGYDTSNYGLFIDVTGGTKNYGISSNAPLKAPAFINTAVGIIDFVGSSTTYSIDFSQHSIFLMYADRNVNVDLPSESRVANYFSLRTLPNDFGFLFYVKAREGSRNIILRNIYNSNEKQQNYELTAGNSIPILVTKSPTFRYQALTKMWV
ncbi:MAG: hypothetical protein GX963_14685, partial [Bacteroidales bacterium]|nr:hypothetical protein [Bacteroidales bacterium]